LNKCKLEKDLPTGKEAELHFTNNAKNWEVYEVEYKNKSDYDLKLVNKNKIITVEVKNDIASYKTGNLGFEYQQSDKNGKKKPSGFMISKADYWIHYYYSKYSWPVEGKYIMVDMAYLRAFIFGIVKENGCYRDIPDAGDNGNDLIVVEKSFCEIFFEAAKKLKKCTLHHLSEEEIKKRLKITYKQIERVHKEKTKAIVEPFGKTTKAFA
jgi:hypothetical protein